MSALIRIRKEVFGCDQAPFGAIAGVSQGTVSRWEAGLSEPTRVQMNRIRNAAAARGILWNDAWFFDASIATNSTAHQDGAGL